MYQSEKSGKKCAEDAKSNSQQNIIIVSVIPVVEVVLEPLY